LSIESAFSKDPEKLAQAVARVREQLPYMRYSLHKSKTYTQNTKILQEASFEHTPDEVASLPLLALTPISIVEL
jgi:hypothetical protein